MGWILKSGIIAALICAGAGFSPGGDDTTPGPGREEATGLRIYDPDPNHPWNSLHAALFVRTGPDGKAYGRDRLEPLLWEDSEYLLKGDQAERAVAALEGFLREGAEARIDDLLKRAILQRDLWLVAGWLAGRDSPESRRMLELVARVIRRLALTPDQIARLPDNYAAAVASKQFPGSFDPERPRRAYLPPELFSPDGPWVCVGRTDGRTAPAHLGGRHHLTRSGHNNPFTNSTFFVFVRLPAGRAAGLKFVGKLARQSRPIFVATRAEDGRVTTAANRDLPTLPPGSELALVRRAMLIDAAGGIVASPLTESVQLRVTTSTSVPEEDAGGPREDPERAAAFELEMRRADLFAGRAGGLLDVSGESDFITGMMANRSDEFEVDRRGTADRFALQPFETAPQLRRRLCFGCHGVSTLYGTRSFQRPWTLDEELDERSPPLFPVAAMEVAEVEKAAVKWKESHPSWLALRKMVSK